MKDDIDQLIEDAKLIENNFFELIKNTKSTYNCNIDSNNYELQRKIFRKYKVWYEVGLRLMYEFVDEGEYNYFSKCQIRVIDAINLNEDKGYDDKNYEVIKNQFIRGFDKQLALLESIIPVIEIEKKAFKKELVLDLLDNEMEQVKLLLKNNYIRPSGVILGVILERYLKGVCSENKIVFKEKDTLQPLINKIYESNKVDWFNNRKKNELEHMASIRNSCSHDNKDEPKKEEVRELLLKVELYLSKEDF